MKAVFVTGTDTGVGKTLVVGLLARYLREQGHRTITQKWVQTGLCEDPSDVATHLALMGVGSEAIRGHEDDVNPYTFDFPASPHLAAAREGVRIDPANIIASFEKLSQTFDAVLVEGAGGIMVPLNEETLLIDVVETLKLPVLIVAGNKLGAINHTLLTVDALQKRDIDVPGIVFNTLDPRADEAILRDNPGIVQTFARLPILGSLPWTEDSEALYGQFRAMAQELWTRLTRM